MAKIRWFAQKLVENAFRTLTQTSPFDKTSSDEGMQCCTLQNPPTTGGVVAAEMAINPLKVEMMAIFG